MIDSADDGPGGGGMISGGRSVMFGPGFLLGYLGYSVLALMPEIAAGSRTVAVELMMAAVLLVGLAATIDLHKRLFRTPAPSILRDSACAASLGFFIFVISPAAFWIYPAVLIWFMGSISMSVASGVLMMRSGGPMNRFAAVNRHFLGIMAGIALPKMIRYHGLDLSWLISTGIAVSLILILQFHIFAQRYAGYPTPFSIWHTLDLRQDKQGLGLVGVSIALGAAMGVLLIEQIFIGTVIIGVASYIVFCRKILQSLTPRKATVFAGYLCAVALVVDGIVWQQIKFSGYIAAFSAAAIYGAVRAEAFLPLLPLSFADQMTVHHWGGILGFSIVAALGYVFEDTTARLTSIAILTAGISYAVSFIDHGTSADHADS